MRDQYAGDIGDYVKLALLRTLSPNRQLSVAWFKTAGPDQGRDGRHIAYLEPEQTAAWSAYDPELHARLALFRDPAQRTIANLQRILEDLAPKFFDRPIESMGARSVWYADMRNWALRSDLLFLDPDNGISINGAASEKSVSREEILDLLRTARTLIVYHHQTRRIGGHQEEIRTIGRALIPEYEFRAVCAVRAAMYSPRAFFLIGPDRQLWDRAEAFAAKWSPHVTFFDITEPPDALGLTPGASVWHRADAAETDMADWVYSGGLDHLLNKPLRDDRALSRPRNG